MEETESKYIQHEGTSYDKDTDPEVMRIFSKYMHAGIRIRIFLGYKETGIEWNEECDTMGYVGRSSGKYKVPILLKTGLSSGGGAVLTAHILKITLDGIEIYKHPNYKPSSYTKRCDLDGTFEVYINNVLHRQRLENEKKADDYIAFMKGKRNRR